MEAVLTVDRPQVLNIEYLVKQMKERHVTIMQNIQSFAPLQTPPPPAQPITPNSAPVKVDPPPTIRQQPVVIAAQREIAMDLVITRDYATACKIKNILVSKEAVTLGRRMKLEGRALYMLNFFITWGDLHSNELDRFSPLLVNLGDLIDCGLSITDIITLGLATNYEQLKSILNFTPADLCVSYRRFNLSHLVQYYGVTYSHLLFDFKLGMVDYFVKLNLSLENIASLGINIEIALNWRKYCEEAYSKAQMIPPTMGGKSSSQISGSLLSLDREMLQRRYEKRIAAFDDEEAGKFMGLGSNSTNNALQQNRFDLPKNWNIYMGLDVSHLYAMKVTRKDLDKWWLKPYNLSIDKLLVDVFCCNDEALLRHYRAPTALPPMASESPRAEKKIKKEKRPKKKDSPKATQSKKGRHKKGISKLKPPTSSTPQPSLASMRASLMLEDIVSEGNKISPHSASSSSSSSSEHDSDSEYSSDDFSFFGISSSSSDDDERTRNRSSSRKPPSSNWQSNIPNVIDKY